MPLSHEDPVDRAVYLTWHLGICQLIGVHWIYILYPPPTWPVASKGLGVRIPDPKNVSCPGGDCILGRE